VYPALVNASMRSASLYISAAASSADFSRGEKFIFLTLSSASLLVNASMRSASLYISAAASSADFSRGEKFIFLTLSSASFKPIPISASTLMILFDSDSISSSKVAMSSALEATPNDLAILSPISLILFPTSNVFFARSSAFFATDSNVDASRSIFDWASETSALTVTAFVVSN